MFVGRAVVVAGGATLFLRTRLAQARLVYRRAFGARQLRRELAVAGPVLLLDAAIFALFFSRGWIDFAEPTLARALLTFAVLFVWYEVWFYVTHRALHTRALYRFHAQHHVAQITHPITSLSFGLLERGSLILGLVGFAAAASQVLPVVLPGLAAYAFLNYALNVWAHLNVELMPAGYPRSRMGGLFIATTFHAMHHARYRGHFGLFTPVLDRALGTLWDDYPDVQARAARGDGLTRIGERMVVPVPEAVGAPLSSRPDASASPPLPAGRRSAGR